MLLPEDDELDAIIELQDHRQPRQAEEVLRTLAERGYTPAMEHLAMMHWHGERLYGPGPWRREEALRWFRRAADNGSQPAREMLRRAATKVGVRSPR